jgi:hypothetical protein
MDDRDRDAFERFARRFAGIEAEVGDPPPFAARRGVMAGTRRRPRGLAAAAGVVALVVLVAVLGPRLASQLTPAPMASGLGAAASAWTPTPSPTMPPTVTPGMTPTPDPFAGLGPAVFCGRIKAEWCDGAIALVRAQHPDEVAAAFAILVDDVCPPQVMCDRQYAFASSVVLLPRSREVEESIQLVVGNSGPELVLSTEDRIPDHMLPLVRAVAAASTVAVDEWRAICVDLDEDTCAGVAGLALNNMARSRPSGVGAIQSRQSCPASTGSTDGSPCWQVRIPVNRGEVTVCMIIGKRPTLGGYGQLAGDQPGKGSFGNKERGCPAGL